MRGNSWLVIVACGVIVQACAARDERAKVPEAVGQGPQAQRESVGRELKADKRWMLLPIKNGAPKRKFELRLGAEVLRAFDVELADEEPEWWAPLDLSPWQGQTLWLGFDTLPEGSKALARVKLADEAVPGGGRYAEPQRPQFHFTALRGRLNDPNGLVYFKGEYHLFFQLFPYGCFSGSKHWGHAVSRDLIHWEELPIALYPDQLGMIFSGSGVVDWKNTSGFQKGAEPPLVLIYTVTGPPRAQAIAYSNDRGRTWTKYADNPVLPEVRHNNRDPKVFWHEPTGHWVMALFCSYPDEQMPKTVATSKKASAGTIEFFVSPDLKQWKSVSRARGFFECPDCFEVPVEGTSQKKWVIHGGSGDYQIGDFDGAAFKPETEMLHGPFGGAFYAGQRFSDTEDGRVVQIGWAKMSATPFAGAPFQQMMNIPCELSIRQTGEGLRLARRPVTELDKLRGRRHVVAPGVLGDRVNPLSSLRAECFDLRADIDVGAATELVWTIRGMSLTLDVGQQQLAVGKVKIPIPVRGGRVQLRLLVDRCLIELFADEGLVYGAVPLLPGEGAAASAELVARGGAASIRSLVADELKSAWRPLQPR